MLDDAERDAREARALEGDDRRGGSYAPLIVILAALAACVMLALWLIG